MNKIRIYFILLALTAVACNKDELITTDVEQVPIITFDTDPAVYPVKVGREFTITPSYQFVDRAVYSWKLEETGKIISTEPQLTYRFDSGNEISEGVNGYYIDLEVTTPNGTTVETVLVEVQELLPPLISFPMQTDGLEVVKGRKYEFAPTVQSAENSNFLWTLRRPGAAEAEPVGDEAVYEFCEEVAGTYEVTLRTENEDGSDEMTIEVEVVDALAVSATAVPIGRKYDGSDPHRIARPHDHSAAIHLERHQPQVQLDDRRTRGRDRAFVHLYPDRNRDQKDRFHRNGHHRRTRSDPLEVHHAHQ